MVRSYAACIRCDLGSIRILPNARDCSSEICIRACEDRKAAIGRIPGIHSGRAKRLVGIRVYDNLNRSDCCGPDVSTPCVAIDTEPRAGCRGEEACSRVWI